MNDADGPALYRPTEDGWLPTGLTRGPWDPDSQHGGAPAALLAGALEALPGRGDMAIARLSYEFLRPVPLAPLALETRVAGAGRRVTRLEAGLHADGREVVRCRALCIRRLDTGALATPRLAPPPAGAGDAGPPRRGGQPSFAGDAMEILPVTGSFREPGPASAWFRLRVPVVAGRPTSPLQRLAAAADFGNGLASVLDWDRHLFINADLEIRLERAATGEWFGLEAATHVGPGGGGLSDSVLHDAQGRVGLAAQTLIIDVRP